MLAAFEALGSTARDEGRLTRAEKPGPVFIGRSIPASIDDRPSPVVAPIVGLKDPWEDEGWVHIVGSAVQVARLLAA